MSAILTVSQINTYIKSIVDYDDNLKYIFVSGEISNFTNHYRTGHFYFTLKDEKSAIKAVMFKSAVDRVRFVPENGMKVIIRGSVSVFERDGVYQLYCEDMQPDGIGALNLAFEQLKNKLSSEGLFSDEHKKSLPDFPERVGVITSPTGAAVHDILSVLERRFPLAEVIFEPVAVQGDYAAEQISEAVYKFNRIKAADVLIVGRGGGSIEDLWAFNEETVARAVFASEIPVISAVGHETDFTICDFVADLRVPTPSAAAEMVCGQMEDLTSTLRTANQRINNALDNRLQLLRSRLKAAADSKLFTQPSFLINRYQQHVDMLSQQLHTAMNERISDIKLRLNSSIPAMLHGATQGMHIFKQKLERVNQALDRAQEKHILDKKHKLENLSVRLESVNPKAVLARGYGIVTNPATGKTIRSVQNLSDGIVVKTELADGTFQSIVSSDGNKPNFRRTLPQKRTTPDTSCGEQMTFDF